MPIFIHYPIDVKKIKERRIKHKPHTYIVYDTSIDGTILEIPIEGIILTEKVDEMWLEIMGINEYYNIDL